MVSKWQFTAVRVELKLLAATFAFRCDEWGSFLGPSKQERWDKGGESGILRKD